MITMASANVWLGRLQSASSAKAVASVSQRPRAPAPILTTFCALISVTSIRRRVVLKEVRQLVAQSVEFQPPQYISFDCYQMDRDGLSLLVTKGKADEQTCEKKAISGPFEILGRVRDPKREGWARLLRWSDDDN